MSNFQNGGNNQDNFQGSVDSNKFQNTGGQGNGNYKNHEEAYDMFLQGAIGRDAQAVDVEQRWQQYGGQSSQQYEQTKNAEMQNNSGTVEYVNGMPNLTQDQLNKEYMSKYPKAYGQPIVAVRKGENNRNIVAFKLQNGQVLDYPKMIQASFDRALEGIEVQNNREGELIVRSSPDSFSSNNLDNLPQF